MFKGISVGAQHIRDSTCYRAKAYPDQAWHQMRDLGLNCIHVGGGQEGNKLHCQLNEHHPYGRAYDANWAENLEALLSKATSYGMKVVFHTMGSYYGTTLGFVAPMFNYSLNAPDGLPYKYVSLADAEVLLDKLAGNNALGHNFITDPRIAWWSPINEARLDIGYVREWTVGMLSMIKTRGGKTSVCVDNGVQPYYKAFPDIIPIIGDYIDYLQAHDYQERTVINPTRNDPTADVYTLSYNAYVHDMQYMLDTRGGFPIRNVMLTEWGMGHRSDGIPWYYHSSGEFWHTKQQQADYIRGCFDAGKSVGFSNILYLEIMWGHPYPAVSTWGFGFINYDGTMTNQLAYDSFKAAAVAKIYYMFQHWQDGDTNPQKTVVV